jgi:putative transcriptional regulator
VISMGGNGDPSRGEWEHWDPDDPEEWNAWPPFDPQDPDWDPEDPGEPEDWDPEDSGDWDPDDSEEWDPEDFEDFEDEMPDEFQEPPNGADSQETFVSLAGKLLVAFPRLLDPNFFRTVTLILEHNQEGALGLVLNRPSETPVSDPLPLWGHLAAQPPVVFVGGPVSPGAAICLAHVEEPDKETSSFHKLFGHIGSIDLRKDPVESEVEVNQIRVFSGYAGWGPGQLETEIHEGGWLVADAMESDVLVADPENLWHNVLKRQKGNVRILATYPIEPNLN